MEILSQNLYLFRDTCHVYVIRSGEEAVLVDFGDGAVLDALDAIGITRVTDILMTHHHRDQAQGLARELDGKRPSMAGARVWAPHAEQELFHSVDQHWKARPLLNNYDVRQDRFSLLEPVPLAGTLQDYTTYDFGGRAWRVLPTPGHTPGSITLLVEIDGAWAAFSGDLIAGPGKVWSMAALQWSYHGVEGVPAMVLSLTALVEQQPGCLLPSHGEIMRSPRQAIELLEERLFRLLDARQDNPNLKNWMREPYLRVTPHLLRNRTSLANSYVLLSDSGKALLIDYGYDFLTANVPGPDRAMHRPLLFSLPSLKRDFGVTRIDAVIATHPHDDHVAGFNLLRSVEGAQVWAAESFASILEHPSDYNLPCLWYDPIPVDRILPLGQAVQWEEYQIVVYPLAGHTLYSVAIGFEVDGKRVLATGDQYKGEGGVGWNYVYQNGFEIEDYYTSALFYEQYRPDLILPGHWAPLWTDERYFRLLRERGETLAGLHRDLLPLESIDLGAEGFAARMQPYHWMGKAGAAICYQVEVRNPLHQEAEISASLILPPGWQAGLQPGGQPGEKEQRIRLGAGGKGWLFFQVLPPPNTQGKRFRLAIDLKAGDYHLGQQAEALVDLI